MSDSPPDDILSWEDLIYIADLVEDAGQQSISLLGGEPFLHPKIIDFIIYLLERNLHVTVFTSGIMPLELIDELYFHLIDIPMEKLSYVCNLNDPKTGTKKENERILDFLLRFGKSIVPGFNIYKPDFDLDFLIQYINRFGLKKSIRLGLTHPIPGQKNKFIQIKDLQNTVNHLMSYTSLLESFRISLGPDCGFPMCCFTDEQIGWMYKMTGGMFRFGCGPAIDIGPDMNVWSCFPLSEFHKKSLFEFDSLHDVHSYYQQKLNLIRVEVGGIFEACDDCHFREQGVCNGGCAAQILNEFYEEAPVRLPEIYG